MPELLISVDLGQAADPTAIAVGERTEPAESWEYPSLAVRQLTRLPLQTPYPDVYKEILRLVGHAELLQSARRVRPDDELEPVTLLVDGTGVGRPVVDELRLRLSRGHTAALIPIMIVPGARTAMAEDGYYHVAKADLVGSMQALLDSGRLKLAQMALSGEFLAEARRFRVKVTRDRNETWRGEGAHDDLVLAIAQMAWWAQTTPRMPVTVDDHVLYRVMTVEERYKAARAWEEKKRTEAELKRRRVNEW